MFKKTFKENLKSKTVRLAEDKKMLQTHKITDGSMKTWKKLEKEPENI